MEVSRVCEQKRLLNSKAKSVSPGNMSCQDIPDSSQMAGDVMIVSEPLQNETRCEQIRQ
jgi:hypothetical protein